MNYNINNKETKLIIEGKEFEIIPFRIESIPRWYVPELGLVIELRKLHKSGDRPTYGWNGASGSIGNDFRKKPFENMIDYAEDLIADLNKDLEQFLTEKISKAVKEKNFDRDEWKKELEALHNRIAIAYQGLGELKLLQRQKQLKENGRKE